MNVSLPTKAQDLRTTSVVLFALAGLLASYAREAPLLAQAPAVRTAPLTEQERAAHLLNRATFGARPQDVERVLQIGREAWIEQQLLPETIESELTNSGPGTELHTGIMVRVDSSRLPQERRVRLRLATTPDHGDNAALANKLLRATRSERQLEQVMADFWVNHFSVYQGKRDVPRALADYDDTVRGHVFGSFREMLGATARHPSMLLYLDNYMNGLMPSGSPATASSATASINENYARELLELHTLGVDGGYTQQDVVEVARAFTGWSVPIVYNANRAQGVVQPAPGPLAFEFRAGWHDAGEKVVLGRTLPAGRGIEDGEDVLDILARHPSTARHIATKLVRHFVADEAPAQLVDALARVFTQTDGDLGAVTRALFTDERFYDPAHYRVKVKRPFEFVVSALRVTNASLGTTSTQVLLNRLVRMKHAPFSATAPTGYPVTAEHWVNTGAMLERMNLALQVSQSAVEYIPFASDASVDPLPDAPVTVDPWAMLGLDRRSSVAADADAFSASALTRVFERTLQGAPTVRLATMIRGELEVPAGSEEVDAFLRRTIALVLGSPEFQRY